MEYINETIWLHQQYSFTMFIVYLCQFLERNRGTMVQHRANNERTYSDIVFVGM